ncbi:2OG-Fe(II) oxygenase family oxidoreductase [Isoalcanivorax pacificus W11-5]|uniref:2OG-Fe(II) oxygenase family oxidoreductase n=1 Tax=Isoalcanivorax pacificus W11-5 TaxID=391936 RepID=A0A0B4XML5_9GAMM|nr:2OG-Fe(II) oxygenase [Isoalcanivorax pacificus]AJD47895.1 2OG-Fe(II) oxygenase family oxidoreductase [Isoalcanivorax pacificus W11-5]
MEELLQPPHGGGLGHGPRDRIVDGLATRGYAVEPAYFSPVLVRALRREALLRDRQGGFTEAAIGRNEQLQQNERIRRDRTCWLNGSTLAQVRLLEEMEQLRQLINSRLFLGLFDLESHFAIYDPGAYYRRHLDAFRGDNPRVVSVVVYLNALWTPADGGCLRLWPQPDAVHHDLDVAPRAGSLVCFLSEQIPHEVLPARHDRLSIAGWFRRNTSTGAWIDPSR